MKVYYVNQYAITPDQPGGTRHYELASFMKGRGINCEIFAGDLNYTTRAYFRRASDADRRTLSEDCNGIKFHWVYASSYTKSNWQRGFSMLAYGVRVFRELIRSPRPGCIIGSSPHLFAALGAAWAATWFRVPFFVEIRDIWPQTLVDMTGRYSPILRVFKRIEDYLYKRASKIIVLARGTEKYLLQNGVDAGKIVYVPNGVTIKGSGKPNESERRATRAKYGLPADRFLAVYSGAHGIANGLDVVLEAAARLKGDSKIGFVLVGDGPTKKDLVDQAKRLGLDNVWFLNPVPKHEIPPLLGAMSAGLMILKKVKVFEYGISPNKLFDYWAASLPVLATFTGGEIAELVRGSSSGTVIEPERADLLAETVRRWAYDTEERELERLGANGFSEVSTGFNREVLGGRLAQSLEEAVT